MKLTITSVELKGFLKFFALSYQAMQILKQLKATEYLAFKKQGLGTTHYTMTLWKSEADLKAFASSGAHLAAMKGSAKIAKEIRTLTLDADKLPDWKTAKQMLLDSGKVIRF